MTVAGGVDDTNGSGRSGRPGREYPVAPIVGVAGVVVRGEEVLLIRRGREPMLGRWSLPGGALELGETMAEGVAREVYEETGLRVTPVEVVATLDRIVRDEEGRVRFHYVLIDWVCRVADGEDGTPVPGDDAQEAAWAGQHELGRWGEARSDGVGGGEPGGYGLEPATLRVIEDALRRAEVLGL